MLSDRKEQVFKLYEKTINTLDDMTEYRQVNSSTVRQVLTDMYRELESINNKTKV